jgi:hypothetical protein
VKSLLEGLRAVLPAARPIVTEGSKNAISPESLRGDPDMVKRAVSLIPNTSTAFPTRDLYRDFGYALKGALPDDEALAFELYAEWCGRWIEGENDPGVVESDWRRMKPPFRLGASWLYEHAEKAAPDRFHRFEEWFQPVPEPLFPEPAPPSTPQRKRLTLRSFDEAVAQALTQSAKPLVKGLLDQGAMTVLYGASNVGKTFVAMDLAYHVSRGLLWGGMRSTRSRVIYVAAEGSAGALKRLAALNNRYGSTDGFQILTSPVDLRNRDADLQPLIALLKDNGPPGLVILDTLSRVLAGGDENSSVDMGALVSHFDAIRSATAAHLLVVHHTGKDQARGARGHSLLRAATDTEIEIGEGEIKVTKQRDLEKSWSSGFELVSVTLGVDEEGDPITSATVRLVDAAAAAAEGMTDAELDEMAAALSSGEYLYDVRGKSKWAGSVLAELLELDPVEDRPQLKAKIDVLVRTKRLAIVPRDDGKDRIRKFLVPVERPSADVFS